MSTKLHFLGAAGTVTGSRYMLETRGGNYMVDCGLFQGGSKLKAYNWEPFPFPANDISAVLLTHAHIDHTGYLPRLIRQGFTGPIYATEATCSLLHILLLDAAHLQEQEAQYANKKGYSRHKPALPLFDQHDAEQAIDRLEPVQFSSSVQMNGLDATWLPAGHILGSAIISLNIVEASRQVRVVFSGDLGKYNDEIMEAPASVQQADYLLVESTYGNRVHKERDVYTSLAKVVNYVVASGGMLLIPAFAVGRTQGILYYLRQLQEIKRIPEIPIYIDSPMAVDVSSLYCQFGDDHNLDVNLLMDQHACPLRCKDTNFVKDVEESKALNLQSGPGVVISASGMCTGGRILHHLKNRLPDERNLVLFVGYQAEGSLGRRLQQGLDKVRIHGENVAVRAQIATLSGLSAHADKSDLLQWLSNFRSPPKKTFIIHGEQDGRSGLQASIREEFGWESNLPLLNDRVILS